MMALLAECVLHVSNRVTHVYRNINMHVLCDVHNLLKSDITSYLKIGQNVQLHTKTFILQQVPYICIIIAMVLMQK